MPVRPRRKFGAPQPTMEERMAGVGQMPATPTPQGNPWAALSPVGMGLGAAGAAPGAGGPAPAAGPAAPSMYGRIAQQMVTPGAQQPGPPTDAIQAQAQQRMAQQMAAAQAAPTQGMAVSQLPQINTGMGAAAPSSSLADAARAQMTNEARAAGVPGSGWDMARMAALGGVAGGLSGSPIGAGIGTGIGALGALLRQRANKKPIEKAKGGLITEPQRMAVGGVAKVRRGYPNCKGMGKATKGGSYKGSR